MAAFHGKGGAVTFTNGTFEVLSWTLNATADMAEGTVMTATWKSFKGGFLDWTATVECILPSAGAVTGTLTNFLGSEATLTLDGGGSNPNFSGNALVTGFSPSTDANDVAKLTYTFQGSGTLTEA